MISKSISRFSDTVILATGWRRWLLSFFAGVIGVLALPPFNFAPAIAVPMCVAVWLIDGAVGRSPPAEVSLRSRLSVAWEASKAGWWLGFGYFLAGLWWLGSAFLVEADQFAWALPLGVIGLPALLAFFMAAGFFVSRLLWSNSAWRILALAVGLGFSEWLRSVAFTGFPWNNIGMALGGNLVLGQAASLVGLHGLTVLTVAIAAAPSLLSDQRGGRTPLWVATAAVFAVAIFGAARLATTPERFNSEVRLRIMQPNLAQDDKFRPEAMPRILSRYLELSGRNPSGVAAGEQPFTHLVWPESPFPVLISRDPDSLQRIGDFLAPQATLLTGAARAESLGAAARYFNSIQVIRPGGVIADSYDKVHLVPFGEYLPFRAVLDAIGLRQFVHVPGGFEAGRSRRLIRAPGLPAASALICYEAIFPGAVTPPEGRAAGAELLLNVTNDAWFGNTPGPRQHFAQARLRAIEEGLPLVRAANTGVSAIVDPLGRIVASLPVGVEDVLDGKLPVPTDPTWYSRHPVLSPFLLWLLVLTGALAARAGRRRAAR